MIFLQTFLLICIYIDCFQCPPVQPAKKQEDSDEEFNKLLNSVDYASYLSQVMNELHKDNQFSKTINSVNSSDSVSEALNVVSPDIRTKLDELKRLEIIRLNKLEKELSKRKSDKYHPHEMPLPPINSVDITHLDDVNPESFNPQDLKRLIDRTTEIFNEIDKRNDQNYKLYEMEKEAKKKAELEKTYSDAKMLEDAQNKWLEEQKSRHSKHKMINEPGSIEQLKSVWKNEDQMSEDSFNPKTFFYMHDVNGDGNIDIAELETLMQKELDKAYDPNDNATDIIERYHEMSRMRKKFLSHVDLDGNLMISLEEFMQWTKSGDAVKNNEWKTQEESSPNYSKEEFDQYYQDYIRRHPELHQPPVYTPPTTPSLPLNT